MRKHVATLLILSVIFLISCGKSSKSRVIEQAVINPEFRQFISGFTQGIISKKDNFSIYFTNEVTLPDDLPKNLLKISPSVDGTLVKSGNSVIFSPKKPLKSGETYDVSLKLGQLAKVPSQLEQFDFSVSTIEQDFEVAIDGLKTNMENPKLMEVAGMIQTADYAEPEETKKMLNFKNGKIEWQQSAGNTHRFIIKNIERKNNGYETALNVSGDAISIDKTEKKTIKIPSLKDFSILSAFSKKSGKTYVSINFSEPLQPNQNLDGLIQLDGEPDPKFVIDRNEVQLYYSRRMRGSHKLTVSQGIKNTFGHALKNKEERTISFELEKPQVKIVGSGSILPSTNGLVMPFEAVGLNAVTVDVIQIFEKNIPQFLQINSLKGDEQIRRVARPVASKTINLKGKADNLSTWNRFTLDLNKIFKKERGAIYEITLRFSPKQSIFPCSGSVEEDFEEDENSKKWSIYESDGFNAWGSYSYRYPSGYRWSERDNPCHVSYYHTNRFPSKKLIASDIGIIAKIGADNSLNVFTTNMVDASPIPANISVLDFQLNELGKKSTDANGYTSFTPEERPFLVIAERNGQKSYLKLDDASSLSMSNFDVSGSQIRDGIKGFIYGERGVWRPGDEMYLSFMLEDKSNRIPANHPVVFELRDPNGQLIDKQVSTSSVNNLYVFETATSDDDLTGNWTATVAVGNATFSKNIKVETIKPNRLKIDFELDRERVTYNARNISPQMNVKWLTGITGANMETNVEVKFSPIKTTFEGFGNYKFDNPSKRFSQDYYEEIFSGSTDENGKTSFSYQMPEASGASGALKAHFKLKAFEPGGNFSIGTKSVEYYPFSSYVGIKLPEGDEKGWLLTDEDHQMDVVLLDSEGKPVSSGNLNVKLYKLNWRWWWDQSEDYSVNYISNGNKTPVRSGRVNISNGKGKFNFKIDKEDWGRYLVVTEDRASGHSSGKVFYVDWPGWAGEGKSGFGASFLQVSADKKSYKVGETAELSIQGLEGSKALVSLENGSKIVDHFWASVDKGQATISVKVTPEMAPNVFAHVTLLQPHAQTSNDLPIRMYGIAPLSVSDEKTILRPEISMSKNLEPNQEVSIKVSEKDGKPMTYTIAVVDEGLLDITGFKTPNAWNHFYRREAIGVKTWDIYDDVIGAFGGRLERLLAMGGDGEEMGANADKKQIDNRFEPVVKFLGPFYSNGSTKTHKFTMPQYIGSVKTMVVAGNNGAYGSAENATPVIKPLMVLGTLPRVVGPGEKVQLPINVLSLKDQLKSATVTVKTEGLMSLTGSNKQTVKLKNGQNTTAYFDLAVADAIGNAKVTIHAKSGGITSSQVINLAVRPANSEQTVVESFTLEKGKEKTLPITFFGMDGTNEATLEISSLPNINLEKRLKYLIQYPHGCIEQTTSSVFPQLYLTDVVDLPEDQKVKVQENIKKGIERIAKFQTYDGGLAYWPGNSDANHWGTNYAFHFLVEAQKKGYFIPKEMMRKLKKFQQKTAKKWSKSSSSYNDDMTQAYRLFTLALAGNPSLSAMNRMLNMPNLSTTTYNRLAAAYATLGKQTIAKELLAKPSNQSDYDYRWSYGSKTRDLAMLLETYAYMNNKADGFKVFKELADQLANERWMSTQTTAYSLLAASKFISNTSKDKTIDAKVTYDGKKNQWKSELPIIKSSLNANASDKKLTIENKGNNLVFVTLTKSGIPKGGNEQAQSNGLDIQTKYYGKNGAINPSDAKQGETITVITTVTNTNPRGNLSDIALTQIFPSGWEIDIERLNGTASSSNSGFDYQDIRDDRVYTYFDLKKGKTKKFRTKVTATFGGKYYLPGAACEAMYDASISAKNVGEWITIGE